MKSVACVLFLAAVVRAIPVSQPVYATNQYISAQQVQPIQLPVRQQPHIQYAQPQYITGPPQQIYQAGPQRTPPPPPPPPQHPPVGITQLLLPSAADRQIQKAAAQLAGPEYAQQVQTLQLQGLANQAQFAAQRRAQLASLRIAQANRQALQPQPPQFQYQLQPTQQAQAPVALPQDGGHGALAGGQPQNAQPEEDYDPSPSYQFGFDVKDDYYTNYQNRKEQRDGDKISGSYSVVDSDGFLRTVSYTADPKEGFKAEVNRQPTDIVVKVPKPTQPPFKQQQYIQQLPVQADRSQLQGQKPRYVYQYQ